MVIYYRGIKQNKPVNPNLYLHAYELRVQHVPYLTLDLRDLAEKFTGLTFKVEFDLSQNREKMLHPVFQSPSSNTNTVFQLSDMHGGPLMCPSNLRERRRDPEVAHSRPPVWNKKESCKFLLGALNPSVFRVGWRGVSESGTKCSTHASLP